MKNILTVFCLIAMYAANSFAATSNISRAMPTKNAQDNAVEEKSSTNTNRATVASRVISRGSQKDTQRQSGQTASSNNTSRSVNVRKRGTRATLADGVNTVGRNARTEAASINSNPAMRRAGIILRASTAEVGGRATIGNTDIQTGSNIDEQVRHVQSRASLLGTNKQKTINAESLASAKDIMEKTSDLNSTCQQQYNECMDQYCAVVDANQKRCSCSANLAKYAKVQEAVEKANTELNDVAQQIRYVGLSADEIRAIMSATEAELEMNKTKDNTKTRSMLDDIADMIKDPTSSTDLTGSSTVDSLLNMDFDFSSDNSDMFSLDVFNSASSDISAKRGTALYTEAKKRCKTVLNRCKDAGGSEDQVSGNYDLAIAKDCIAYEQGLDKLNTTLKNNVRSANMMLQKARLAVLQNKNQYDIRGCIGALENCMLDDMVCGDNYLKCLDPTKRYIDENGKVVLGRNLPNITNMMTNYNNTNVNADFIKAAADDATCRNNDGACIVNYLMTKIGTGATVKDGGLCRAVLDKCQDYTYAKHGKVLKYEPYNEVVVNYIQRAMVNIKAAQSKIISDYASSCMADVEDCYNQQNTQITSWTTSANANNVYQIMKGACYNVALTCGYAVFAYDVDMGQKIQDIQDDASLSSSIKEAKKADALINGISELFYQSFLCPENSVYTNTLKSEANVGDQANYVNDRCVCKDGYVKYNGICTIGACDNGEYWYAGQCYQSCPSNTFGTVDRTCVSVCPTGYYGNTSTHKCDTSCPNTAQYHENNVCVQSCSSGLVVGDDYECVSSCPSGKYKEGNQCVDSCSNTLFTDVVNNECVSSCPSGLYTDYVNRKCDSSCASGYACRTNSRCVSDCSSDCGNSWIYSQEHSCVLQCTPGYSANGYNCVALSAPADQGGSGASAATGANGGGGNSLGG